MDQVKQKTVSKIKEYMILFVTSLTQNDANIKEEELKECFEEQDSKRIQSLEGMFKEDKTAPEVKNEGSNTKQSQKENWDKKIHYTLSNNIKTQGQHTDKTETKTQEQR